MDCGSEDYASSVLERYGYYRLSGYWYPYREWPDLPAPRFDKWGHEIRLDTFVPGTSLEHVVSLYEFDGELRTRLGGVLSMIETAFRFFIGHRLGRVDPFAHRNPEVLDAMKPGESDTSSEPTAGYLEWLEEYDGYEKRARGAFITHFREKYGPNLPIWVATEVMSFGVLNSLYKLMKQGDQEILAARFQIHTADGRGDRGALRNWLNNLRNVRNICAHYGRLWNRTFDVLINAPGKAREDNADPLVSLVNDAIKNTLYGVLLVMRYLLLSITPERADVVDVADFIESQSKVLGFRMSQLGFPDGWRDNQIWDRGFALDRMPMLVASLLDRAESMTAAQTREALTSVELTEVEQDRTAEEEARAKKAAQRKLLRTYRKYKVVIEIELGRTKYYPAFQFRDGSIIDVLAEVNEKLVESCGCDALESACVARALLDWWQAPHPDLPKDKGGSDCSPLDLLGEVSEREFEKIIREAHTMSSFVPPDRQC